MGFANDSSCSDPPPGTPLSQYMQEYSIKMKRSFAQMTISGPRRRHQTVSTSASSTFHQHHTLSAGSCCNNKKNTTVREIANKKYNGDGSTRSKAKRSPIAVNDVKTRSTRNKSSRIGSSSSSAGASFYPRTWRGKKQEQLPPDENHVYAESLLYLLNLSEQNESTSSSLKAQAAILRTILERDHNDNHAPHSKKLANTLQKRNPHLLKVWHAVHKASALHEEHKKDNLRRKEQEKQILVNTDTLDTYSTSAVCSDEVEHLLCDDDLAVSSSSSVLPSKNNSKRNSTTARVTTSISSKASDAPRSSSSSSRSAATTQKKKSLVVDTTDQESERAERLPHVATDKTPSSSNTSRKSILSKVAIRFEGNGEAIELFI
jgi:hypothetical protein